MANNKIVYGDQTLIDLTSDTVTPETLAMGETAHSASGAQIVGTMSPSGGTHITPSNASPVALTSGDSYIADGNGYAIGSYRSISPSNTPPVRILAGDMDYNNSSGYAIENFRSIIPHNDPPVTLSSGEMILPQNNGYCIAGYTSVTPSNSGTYFTSGMRKMSSSGYAYSSKPTFKPTALWTNPSTSTSTSSEFAAQDITLSQSITNFDYIGIYWEHAYGLATTSGVSIWESAEIPLFSPTLNKGVASQEGFFGFYYRNSSSTSTYYWFLRNVGYNSDTSLHISNCWRMVINTSGTNTKYNSRVIPKKIYGYKISA